jgi:hypothetical protein
MNNRSPLFRYRQNYTMQSEPEAVLHFQSGASLDEDESTIPKVVQSSSPPPLR